jgi:RNA polymerase sigma-70 factor (ECF subfamily)
MNGVTRTAAFEDLRGLMFSIAYRMTGSVTDAEDIAQEAFVRLERERANGRRIESPRAWLSAVTTRISIDHLRSARRSRETYVGPWLPEPLVADSAPGPEEHAETADTLSQAFLVMLESLSPVERAVFLLREVFGYEYAQIAGVVGKSEDNTRQLAARARRHADERRPRFDADRRRHAELLRRFQVASLTGDTDALKDMLAADAVLYSDGGGKARAARRPIYGPDRIARLMAGVTRKTAPELGFRRYDAEVNGVPGGVLVAPDGSVFSVLTIDVADGKIQTVRIVRNPDKLRHVHPQPPTAPAEEEA